MKSFLSNTDENDGLAEQPTTLPTGCFGLGNFGEVFDATVRAHRADARHGSARLIVSAPQDSPPSALPVTRTSPGGVQARIKEPSCGKQRFS